MRLFAISFCLVAFAIEITALNLRPIQKICRVCKLEYDESDNTPIACQFHKGRFMGAENAKHSGTRSGGENRGLLLFWDCCDATNPQDKGCRRGKHISYDEEVESPYMLNRPSPA